MFFINKVMKFILLTSDVYLYFIQQVMVHLYEYEPTNERKAVMRPYM